VLTCPPSGVTGPFNVAPAAWMPPSWPDLTVIEAICSDAAAA